MDTTTIEIITTLIGSWGFPIVCCYFLWKYINSTMKEFTVNMTENTKMLNKIHEKLNMYTGDKDNE